MILHKIGNWLGCFARIFRFAFRSISCIYSGYYTVQFKNKPNSLYLEYPASLISGSKYITIGNNFVCRSRLRLEAIHIMSNVEPKVLIGNNVQINNNCHIGCINKIEIGDNVLIGSNVFITDHSHGKVCKSEINTPPSLRDIYSKGPVIIKNNVWIGENVSIMPNVTIGMNSIIGANSIVTKDVPDFTLVVGNPAKVLKSFL